MAGRALVRPALIASGLGLATFAATWLLWARREPALEARTRDRLRSARED